MGTDIRTFMEVKPDDQWELIGPRWKPSYWDYLPEEQRQLSHRPYSNRNYTVFGVLANVRNGRGFGGADLGDPVTPIAMPKGEPADMSKGLFALINDTPDDEAQERLGNHDFSHLTLAEMAAYDWEHPMTHRGVITLDEYKLWRQLPPTWPNGGYAAAVSGTKVRTLTPEQADERLDANEPSGDLHYYVHITWQSSIAEACADFFPAILQEMREVAKEYNLTSEDRVRLVFGFDS